MLTAMQISDDGVELKEAQHRSQAESDQHLFDDLLPEASTGDVKKVSRWKLRERSKSRY